MRRLVIILLLFAPAVMTARGLWSRAAAAAAYEVADNPVLMEIRRRVPPDGAVDVVILSEQGRETGVFAGAALASRDVRFFTGWDDWRARRRTTFMRDARAANAPPGPLPGPALLVVTADRDVRIVQP